MTANGNGEPGSGPPQDAGQASTGKWEYLGVGCFSAIVGLFGGGMIAVLISKIVGALGRCAPDKETGAPCSWTAYWTWGARIGLVLVPIVSIWLFRRGRRRAMNSDRG
jgi:hypothetical protein